MQCFTCNAVGLYISPARLHSITKIVGSCVFWFAALLVYACYVVFIVETRIHCQESGEESSEVESIYSLKCHISQEVNHLHEGLKQVRAICFQYCSCWKEMVFAFTIESSDVMILVQWQGLKSELEKASPSLGRSAVYIKESRINGLPRYLFNTTLMQFTLLHHVFSYKLPSSRYLTIQFVRFFWKRESNQKAKILRVRSSIGT